MSVKSAGLPNITGWFNDVSDGAIDAIRTDEKLFVMNWSKENLGTTTGNRISARGISFNASKANALYGAADTVQPPAVVLIPQIRF